MTKKLQNKALPALLTVCFFLLLQGCASIKVEHSYKNPEIVLFHANRVLVVGMTPDFGTREKFETQMQEKFDQQGVEAVRSIDLFDVTFTASQRTEEELDRVEQQLLDKDFDAILFTKLVDRDTQVSLGYQIQEMGKTYDRFRDDYLIHQGIYYDQDETRRREEYFAETSLYCICVGKERELIWRSNLRISQTRNQTKLIRKYVELLVSSLEEQQLIIGHDPF
ncbi:MAG: hypothetical protein P8X60_02535 [Robiginitalea sp.]|jgi:hypothetical protein